MSRTIHCPQCGAEQSSDAVEGLCPDCLARLALGGSDMPEDLGLPGPEYRVPGADVRFGDYELIEEIAQGGMGVVYKAKQSSLNRIVAVKMIRFGHLAREEDIRRFRTEAEAAANLQHPNIVAIHEVGYAEGQHFFSMDYIDGGSLADLIRERPLPPRKAAAYLKKVAEAIHYAHSRGVLHRDMKPSNVLLAQDHEPKVTDFGLAKLMQSDSKLTLSGTVMGSPSYMSPEQASGHGNSVDVRSDVYSMGAILYELLTGRPPFQADTTLEILRLVAEAEPVSLRQLNKNIPHDLDTICLKCLEKDAARRYATAKHLADELGRFLNDEPITARPVGPLMRSWRWCRRNPALASAFAGMLAVFLAGFVGVAWQWRIAQENAREERAARVRAEEATVQALLGKSRTMRLAGLAGQRLDGLDGIRSAVARQRQLQMDASLLELRDEVIACLSLPDLRLVRAVTNEHAPPSASALNRALTHYAEADHLGNIRIRRVEDQQVIAEWRGGLAAKMLMFSPGDRYLAALHEENDSRTLRLWDLGLKSELPQRITLVGAEAIDFAPDGQHLAVGLMDGTVTIHALPSLQIVRSFSYGAAVHKLRYRPNGTAVAAFSPNSLELSVFALGPGEESSTRYIRDRIIDLAWHPTGKLFATVSTIGRLSVYVEGKDHPLGIDADVWRAAFNHAGTVLATVGTDLSIRLWDISKLKMLVRLQGSGTTELPQLQFSEDDQVLACHSGSMIELVKVSISKERRYFMHPHAGTLAQSDISPDGNLLCMVGSDGIHLWNLPEGRLIGDLQLGAVRSAFFDQEKGDLIVRSDGAGLFRLPLLATQIGEHGILLAGPPEPIAGHAFDGPFSMSANGSRLAMAKDDEVLLLSAIESVPRRTLHAEGGLQALAISPDGKWVAGGILQIRSVRIWDAATGEAAADIPVEGEMALAFSPDSQWLAVTSQKSCQLWKAGAWTHEPVLLRTHPTRRTPPVPAFSPDGSIIAVAASSLGIELIDVSNKETLARLELPDEGVVVWMQFAPDGSKLYSLQPSSPLIMWDIAAVRTALKEMGLDWAESPARAPAASRESMPRAASVDRLLFNPGNLQRFASAWAELEQWRMRLEEDPQEERLYRKVAECEHVLHRHEQIVAAAGAWLEKVKNKPGDEMRRQEWHAQRADSLAALGRFEEAAEEYRQCAEINCANGWGLKALKDLSSHYLYAPPPFRNLDMVKHYADLALRLNPDDQTALSRIGMAEFRSGRYEQSRPILERSCDLSDGSTACYALVILYARAGRIAEAKQLFESNTAALLRNPGFLTERERFLNWAREAEDVLRREQAKAHSIPSS
jgi:eukaryotic-like serine/threonine-protein kinase